MKPLTTQVTNHDTIVIKKEISCIQAIKSCGKILLPVSGGFYCCEPDEILCLKSKSNYTEVTFTNGLKKLLSKTLGSFEEIFPGHLFFRIHRSYLINAGHIKCINLTGDESFVTLSGNINIPISREKKYLFK